MKPQGDQRLAVLDGWRGLSILAILACHLLPLGPKAWHLNDAAGPLGMALFFTLSGFLIARFLLEQNSVLDFLIRRFVRIVPLAWLYMIVMLTVYGSTHYASHMLFVANLLPDQLVVGIGHLWSLCVEVQFYAAIALLVAIFGKRGLYVLPAVCLSVTIHRVTRGAYADINTLLRVDEILAGSTLALAFAHGRIPRLNRYMLASVFVAFLISCHPSFGAANYARPYLAALLVGSTLVAPPRAVATVLESATLRYVAEISFALYVVHPSLAATWLGEGDKWVKYLKRPLLFAAAFALAHLSTRYYERPFIELGRQLSRRAVVADSSKAIT